MHFWISLVSFQVLLSISSFAQSRVPIRLNRHFYEIPKEDSLTHQFNKLVSYTPDSIKIERIFDLENRMIRQIKTFPPTPDIHEKTTEQFEENGKLLWRRTENLLNDKFIQTYFHDNEQVGQVLYEGNRQYFTQRAGEPEPTLNFENDFLPQLFTGKEEWINYLSKNLKVRPSELPDYDQKIIAALYVDEKGMVTQTEWANPLGGEKKFADRFIELIKEWNWSFLPAKDSFGNPKGEWITIPLNLNQPEKIQKGIIYQ
ncbi:hypothetical protein DFQ04_1526 [Algoriphagus boseongensis]|uniref:TonB-like protein n=1 Tax=Algoriphagus boseongensis TaxID=1442587 RepID=A0A4R6TA47_9BACT|nr:hypothetical protein [Algoriphagus boseongensis]TDQ19701.1 hypothetical protein DFQ04_1526 [Algoriphagus boseongensis]